MIDRKSGRRRLAPVIVGVGLLFGAAGTPVVRAQEPAPAEESKGDPVPGYLGVLLLCIGIMFVVGKSARR